MCACLHKHTSIDNLHPLYYHALPFGFTLEPVQASHVNISQVAVCCQLLRSVLSVITRPVINQAGPEWQPEITEIRGLEKFFLFPQKRLIYICYSVSQADICLPSAVCPPSQHSEKQYNFTSWLFWLICLDLLIMLLNAASWPEELLTFYYYYCFLATCAFIILTQVFAGPVKLKILQYLNCLGPVAPCNRVIYRASINSHRLFPACCPRMDCL